MHPWFAGRRMAASHLTGPPLADPVAVVAHLGAVQSQDVGMSQWGVARRTAGATLDEVGAAVDRGEVLRTHVLRPTWHYVVPTDLPWMLQLTADRVARQMATVNRAISLTDDHLRTGLQVLADVLDDGAAHRREDLAEALAAAGLASSGTALAHQVMTAEIRRVAVSGPRDGVHHTYVRFADRVPDAPPLDHDDALLRLARTFVRGHGPTRPHDLAWWSGLPVGECRRALDLAGLGRLTADDGAVFHADPDGPDHGVPPALLLPPFDELVSHARTPEDLALVPGGAATISRPGGLLLVDGRYAGTWRRTVRARVVSVEVTPYVRLGRAAKASIDADATRYAAAVRRDLELSITT